MDRGRDRARPSTPAAALAAVSFLLVAAGCATAPRSDAPGETRAPETAEAPGPVPALHATLWTQTSAGYRAATLQAYRLAGQSLKRALRDPTWSALVGVEEPDGPPAIILDVDETVLDNSAYNARRIRAGAGYTPESWARWVEQAAAPPVPGALAFVLGADDVGVSIYYVTNRDAELEDGTRRNLRRLGFPVEEGFDVVLTRGEIPAWDTSDKTPRRRHVAADFRVLLLVGDNLGDFIDVEDASVAQRHAVADRYEEMWGRRWIVLPNPQYGSWEGAAIGYRYGAPVEEKVEAKRSTLDPRR